MTDSERFTIGEEESERIISTANWWADLCRAHDREPPEHPLTAILEAAEYLRQCSAQWAAQRELQAHKQAGGRVQ